MSNPRFYFEMFGFFPTSKESQREREILILAENKIEAWLASSELHAGNARWRYHDIGVFAEDEAKHMFEDTSKDEELKKLLPTIEACETFIKAVIFAKISENNQKFLGEKQIRGSWGGGGVAGVPSMASARMEGGGGGGTYFRQVPLRDEFPVARRGVGMPMRGVGRGRGGLVRHHHHRADFAEIYPHPKRGRHVIEDNEQEY
jgi:hypothetical protein